MERFPDLKSLKDYVIKIVAKYPQNTEKVDLVVTSTKTKCMFPLPDMPNMYGRDYDDDLDGEKATDMWNFVNTLKHAPETHFNVSKNEIVIGAVVLLNILSNMDNNGKGIIIS